MVNIVGELLGYDTEKILEKDKELNILILGAYRPKNMQERLETIRDCLIEKGFVNTSLVADFPDDIVRFHEDDDIHWTKKSNFLMSRFDINLFIFFTNCDNSGPTDELNFFCYEIGEHFRCIVTYEDGFVESISSRITAKIKDFKLRNIAVKEEEDMVICELAFGLINLVMMKERNKIYKIPRFSGY